MRKQLTYVAPLKAGIVLAVLYGILSLIAVPFLLLGALFGAKAEGMGAALFGVGFAIAVPVLYAVAGFLAGVIVAALYNLIARWAGGFEFEVRDVSPSNPA